MKVAILTNMWPSGNRPYFGIFVKKFADELKKRDVSVQVVKPAFEGSGYFLKFKKYLSLRSALRSLKSEFEVLQVEYAFPTDVATWWLPRPPYNKKVVVFHGSDVFLWKKIPFGSKAYRQIVKSSNALVFPSKNLLDSFSSTFRPEVPCFVIPRGIDEAMFEKSEKEECRKMLGLSDFDVVILSVANFVALKNHKTIIEALSKLKTEKRVVAVFVGDGPQRNTIEELAEKLKGKVKVIFAGATPYEKVRYYYDSADIFVSASLSEGYSVSVQEAMAKGLSVVVSDIPAHREAVENLKTGLLFNPENPEELSELLDTLVKDENLRNSLGEAARKSDKIWTMQRTVDEYLKVYKLVLS